jgi:hypothetical protein
MTSPRGLHLQTARLFVFTLLVVLLIIAPTPAQSPLPSEEMLREVRDEINSTTGSTATSARPILLPDTPVPQRAEVKVNVKVIDKKFIDVMAALGGAESLRFTTHKLVLNHEFAAGAPWVSSVPANPQLVARYAAIYAAELLVAYELKKPHSWLPGDKVIRKLWWAYPAAMMAIHIKNGVGSIRTQAPSCPVAECQGP